MGPSKQEKVFNQLQNYNPQASNRWDTFRFPFSAGQQIGTLNKYTDLGRENILRQGASDVAGARSAAGARATAGGYGGSVAEDIISGAGERAGVGTTNALQGLELGRLGQLPGIMNTANQGQFNVTQAGQGVDFQNILNMLNKFNTTGSMAQNIDQQPGVLADIFAGLNAASGFINPLSELFKKNPTAQGARGFTGR